MNTLAIDQGTTSTRALLVDEHGNPAPLLTVPHRQIYAQPGWVEHDAEELMANVHACIAAAGEVDEVGAIGIDNQGESCLAWDADTGKTLGPVIVWQDYRTRAEVEQLRCDGAASLVRERAGLPLDAYFSASKLGWIMREIPQAAALVAKGRLRLGTTDAFFRDRLTGRFETDVTTASRTSLMNLKTCEWDEELCSLFGVPMHALPRIGPSTGELGAVSCGAGVVPLSASLVDQQASLYGHGCRTAGDCKVTFGTGAFAMTLTGAELCNDAGGPLPTVAWQKTGELPTYALDGGIHTAASAVNWARDIGLFQDFAEISSFTAKPAIARGLVFVPALSGLACPHWDRQARGSWMGLSLDTTPADMVQAILEGIALRMVEVVAAIESRQRLSAPLSIDGGMTNNAYFCQFLADVSGREIIVSDEPELTAIGIAAFAAEAVDRPFDFQRKARRISPKAFFPEYSSTFSFARKSVQNFISVKPANNRIQ